MKKQMLTKRAVLTIQLRPIAALLAAVGWISVAHAGPQDGIVRAGNATISGNSAYTRVDQTTGRAIIDWRSFSIGSGEQVQFVQPSASSATLNRVTGSQVSTLLGRLDANGQVLLINPNGIVIGKGGQVNVASFIASTSNIRNDNFMSGRLIFDEPGKPGAGVLNAGSITAAEGGLVALVAPHVRNDGLIQARLGKVLLGAADTFTIDLYGDQLVNLALSDSHVGQLFDANGQRVQSLITQTGKIEAGQAVLVTAATARNVLDNLINMSGTIKAETAMQDGGRIVLLGEGGKVNVSGTLEVTGNHGGQIEVLGQDITLATSAIVNASGTDGGGTMHIGGAWQGGGNTYRAQSTTVESGVNLTASALNNGNGGEVVVWSDRHTTFAGNVEAKGGAQSGDGGRMEVSGKRTLAFTGAADASAQNGTNGSLLLDPAYLNIGLSDAGLISKVLRTGTSTTLQADVDINVNAIIDGRGYIAGGGLAMSAGNNININDFVVTNNGAVNLTTGGGTVNVAAGKAVFAGSAPIAVSAGGNLSTGPLLTSGALSLASRAGSVAVNSFIDANTGPVTIAGASDVDINQPIISLANGNPLNISAGNDIRVNAQIDGRGGAVGGAANLTAGRNVNVNNYILTNNGAINIIASGGIAMSASTALLAGTAPISVTGAGNVTTSPLLSSGAIAARSTGGSLAFGGSTLDGTSGPITLNASGAIDINQPIVNARSDAPLSAAAGTNINVNAQIDGRDGDTATPSGTVTLIAGQNINLNKSIVTDSATINLTAQTGGIAISAGNGLFAVSAPISVTAASNVATGPIVTSAQTMVQSTAGSINFGGTAVDGSAGPVTLNASGVIDINQPIVNTRSDAPLSITAGTNINVNAQIDGRDGNAASPGGTVSLIAGQNIFLNQSVITENANAALTAQNGTITTAAGKGIFAGAAPIALTAGGNLTTGAMVTTGSLSVRSTGGSITMNTPFTDPAAPVGPLTFTAATGVDINQPIANTRSDAPLNVIAGTNININAKIDGRDANAASPSGAVTLTAGQNINLNQSIATENAALALTASTGTITTAPAMGLFSGSAPLSVTSGGTLTTGILSTTGALGIRSTAGSVNIATPIADTVSALTVNAANTVNVNQPITNLKSGNDLTITAGTDINVNAQIDGRSGVLPGGSVTLTAGNNLNVNEHITTSDGAANLTAINGSVALAPAKQVSTGSAPITIVSGGNFSTGAAPPPIPDPGANAFADPDPQIAYTNAINYASNFLKDYVQLVTTGALNITSTSGNVNVDAPIADTTGPVTITAGNSINVKQHINSNNHPIVLNAGAGGITVFSVSDSCGSAGCFETAAIDARNANLTLNSVGNISIASAEIATGKVLSIDTRGTLTGGIGFSQNSGPGLKQSPQSIVLIADGGIPSFFAGLGGISDISATSSNGSIGLGVFKPDKLRVTTGCAACDISTGSFIGPDVVLNAGGTINLKEAIHDESIGTVTLLAGSDVNFQSGPSQFSFKGSNLTVVAGRDVNMGADANSTIWVSNGPLSITAGRDIVTTSTSPIHISNGENLILNAGRNVTLNLLETLGPVSITAATGSMTLNNDIGPHIINNTGGLDFNPNDMGVASLTLSAPAAAGSINMQGARAEGNVVITTGGNLTAAKAITSVQGSVTIAAAGNVVLNNAVPIGSQSQVVEPQSIPPVNPPGPLVPPPNAPGIVGVGTPGLPAFPDILITGAPDATGGLVALPSGSGGGVGLPGSPLAGGVGLPASEGGESGTDTSSAQRAAQQQNSDSQSGDEAGPTLVADGGSLVFTGGRGLPSLQGLATVPCPPGVASGSAIKTKNNAGQEVTVTCK